MLVVLLHQTFHPLHKSCFTNIVTSPCKPSPEYAQTGRLGLWRDRPQAQPRASPNRFHKVFETERNTKFSAQEWRHHSEKNGMLQHSFGGEVIFLSLQHFICSILGFKALLASPCYEGLHYGHLIQEGSCQLLHYIEKFSMVLINKMDSKRQVKVTIL